jgi:hypothetical protein
MHCSVHKRLKTKNFMNLKPYVVNKKIDCLLHYNMHKILKTKIFMELKPNVVMEHV